MKIGFYSTTSKFGKSIHGWGYAGVSYFIQRVFFSDSSLALTASVHLIGERPEVDVSSRQLCAFSIANKTLDTRLKHKGLIRYQ